MKPKTTPLITMRAGFDRLFEAAGYVSGLFLLGTLLAVLTSILGRLHPAFDLPGADAYAGYCMASSAFLALAPTLRRGEHIRVSLILGHLPQKAHSALDIGCHVVAVGLSVALAWFSVRLVLVSHQFTDISTGLDATPLWIPQLGMAAGALLFALAFLEQLMLLLGGQPLLENADGQVVGHVE